MIKVELEARQVVGDALCILFSVRNRKLPLPFWATGT